MCHNRVGGPAEREEGPLCRLAIQSLPGTGSSWHIVALTKVVCVFRGAAIKQGVVACLNGVSLKKDRIYVRTSGCHTLPGGVYITEFRSVKQAHRVLPHPQFFFLNLNTLLNQDWLLGANALEIRGTTRMIAIHDDRTLLPVRLLVSSANIPEVRKRIGLPVRQRRKSIVDKSLVNRI